MSIFKVFEESMKIFFIFGNILLIKIFYLIFCFYLCHEISNILSSNMNFEQLGHIIRERRNELSYSQEVLSDKSDVAIKTIHSIELGKANPSLKTLDKVLGVLGLELIVVSKKD